MIERPVRNKIRFTIRCVALLLITAVFAFAQSSPSVSIDSGPPTRLYFYDGSDQLIYQCKAQPNQPSVTFGEVAITWARSDSTLTNIIDSSNTSTATTSVAHNLAVGETFVVTGATVDTDLNGTNTVLTVATATTFTFATADVADATYTESTLQIVAHSGSAAGLLKIVNSSTTGTATTSADHGLVIGNEVVIAGAVATTFTKAATTLTNVVVLTDVGTVTVTTVHGLSIGSPVSISGATVDTDLNDDYVVRSITSSLIFTITTVSVSDATYTESTLSMVVEDDDLAGTYIIQTVPSTTTFTVTTASVIDGTFFMRALDTTPLQYVTDAPRTTQGIWAITRYQYNATGNYTSLQWATGNIVDKNVCDDRASLEYK